MRHATYVVPDAADDAALAPTLARVATDADADPATRCLALAALGRVALLRRDAGRRRRGQFGAERRVARRPRARARVSSTISQTTTRAAAYACRTLENVLAQASAKRAAPLPRAARGRRGGASRGASRTSRRRRAGGPRRPRAVTKSAAALGLAAPAAVRQACAGLGGAPAVAAACADALRHSDDARWQLAHLNVANSVASDGGLACAEAPGLAPALARALAGGRALGARAGQVRRGARAHLPARAGGGLGDGARARRGSSRPSSAPPRATRTNCAPTRRRKGACARGRVSAPRRPRSVNVKACAADALPLAARRRGVALPKGAVVSSSWGCGASRSRRCVDGNDAALIAGMPAVLDALVARDGAVLVPFADACAAPPRGLFVVALERSRPSPRSCGRGDGGGPRPGLRAAQARRRAAGRRQSNNVKEASRDGRRPPLAATGGERLALSLRGRRLRQPLQRDARGAQPTLGGSRGAPARR